MLSVGSVSDCYDNALAETINGLYEAEVIWRHGSNETASGKPGTLQYWNDGSGGGTRTPDTRIMIPLL